MTTHSTSFDPDALVSALKDAGSDPGAELTLQRAVQSRLAVSMLGLEPVPPADGLAANAAASVAPKAGLVLSKVALACWLGAVFSAGTLTGLGVSRLPSWSPRPASHVAGSPMRLGAVDTPPPAPEANPPVGVDPSELELVAASPQKLLPSATASSTEVGTSLALERRILDEARQALARGQPAEGLAPLERHAARFPKGVLTEERDALYVRVLAAMGNRAAALARAQAFRRRFPQSIFLPAVEGAVGSISEQSSVDASKP